MNKPIGRITGDRLVAALMAVSTVLYAVGVWEPTRFSIAVACAGFGLYALTADIYRRALGHTEDHLYTVLSGLKIGVWK